MTVPSLGDFDTVTHVIQLAVAPVFLLNAVGAIIAVLVNRLARVIDRIRALEERLRQGVADELPAARAELAALARRLRMIHVAIALEVICALLVGLVIAIAFLDAFITANLAKLIAGTFVAGMIAFIAALAVFLREIFVAVQSMGGSLR